MLRALSGLILVGLVGVSFAAEKAVIGDVLKTPAKYDGKMLILTGKIAEFKARKSKAGHDYSTFTLSDGKSKIAVFMQGRLAFTDGTAVKVTGKFSKLKKVGKLTFTNEMDASPKDGKVEKLIGVTPKAKAKSGKTAKAK